MHVVCPPPLHDLHQFKFPLCFDLVTDILCHFPNAIERRVERARCSSVVTNCSRRVAETGDAVGRLSRSRQIVDEIRDTNAIPCSGFLHVARAARKVSLSR